MRDTIPAGHHPAKSPSGGPAETSRPAAGVTSAGAPLRIGAVALTVRDLDAVGRFYQQVIGLKPVEAGPGFAGLGVGGTVLLELRHDPAARIASPQSAGLFHTAFLLPSRADLAQWLVHAADAGVTLQGASDHLVSEAIYLADPEGNGIEVYRDRPSEEWCWRDGMVEMATRRLDLADLAGSAPTRDWSGLPTGSIIGHVHLQVGGLEAAETFYAGLLGLDIVRRSRGATFYSSGGYHHHIATNIWNSAGAPPRPAGMTGLASLELVAASEEVAADLAGRIRPLPATALPEGLGIQDPWGTQLVLRTNFHSDLLVAHWP